MELIKYLHSRLIPRLFSAKQPMETRQY